MLTKEKIRKEILGKRLKLKNEEVKILSLKIQEKLEKIKEINEAKIIMGYYPIRNEVDILDFLRKKIKEKIIAFPKCDIKRKTLVPVKVHSFEKLKFAEYNIPIPKKIEKIDSNKIDVILLPGIAFSIEGYRIGYGLGYYDNFLKKINALKVGIGYDFQIIKKFPVEKNDIRLNMIISEKRIIKIK